MKNFILGVTGSVAAIKTKSLVEALSKLGNVRLVITQHGEYFVKSEFEFLQQLGVPVYRDSDEWPVLQGRYQVGDPILHIEMRRWAKCLIVAPLDANTLAKISHGFCDNLLTSIIRAWDWNKPMFLCPAMNTMMWNNKPTLEQISLLRNWGSTVIEPIEKRLACNDIGMGAMASVEDIVRTIERAPSTCF